MDNWTKVFWAELEHLGEDQVRARLATKFYSDAEREGAVREWLQQKELARGVELEFRRSKREAEQREEASRASKAAERAAEAAERSARAAKAPDTKALTRASIAIMIAVTAVIISVLSLLAHFLK
jgi:hypothetical protein